MKVGYKNIVLAVLMLTGCVEPFDPPVSKDEAGFLVVDSYLNTSSRTINVKLSRAVPLSEVSGIVVENNANVEVETSTGETYPVTANGNGSYSLMSPDFQAGKQYRLHIQTQDGQEYRSAFVLARQSPEIDELTWVPQADGLTIKVSTHDSENTTRYYRWEYIETWKYTAAFSSDWKLEGGQAVFRSVDEQIYTCYNNEASDQILTYNTNDLSEDRVADFDIAFVPQYSPKISNQYSILVKQYALSKEAYDYWQQLRVSTETLGGLFDPQPSRVKGNIKNINSDDEAVIGYFDAGGLTEKRIFIMFTELPKHLQRTQQFSDCTTSFIAIDSLDHLPGSYLLTNGVYVGITLIGFNVAPAPCADCRTQGGKLKKPDFWP